MDLSVVVISVNAAHFLRPCLQSLYANPPRFQFEVWVIDNNSADDTQNILSQYPGVNNVRIDGRHTFSRNNNLGILRSTGRYILILNPDTEIYAGALDRLVEFMESRPEAGACGPMLLNPDGSLQWSCRYFPTPASVLVRGTPLGNWLGPFKRLHERYLMADWDHSEIREVDWVLGACLLVRRETIADVGLLDEQFRKYYEDIDWCYRIKHGGWKVYYIPQAQVLHHYQRASARGFNRNTLLHGQSILRFFWKHRLNRA